MHHFEISLTFLRAKQAGEKRGKISICCKKLSQGGYSYFTFPLEPLTVGTFSALGSLKAISSIYNVRTRQVFTEERVTLKNLFCDFNIILDNSRPKKVLNYKLLFNGLFFFGRKCKWHN